MERDKQIEERVELEHIISDAIRGYEDLCEECYESGDYRAFGYEEYIADSVISAGYRKQVEGENITENHPVDEFICEKCGFITRDCCRYEIDEDDGDEICYEFAYRFCPRCGMKVKRE